MARGRAAGASCMCALRRSLHACLLPLLPQLQLPRPLAVLRAGLCGTHPRRRPAALRGAARHNARAAGRDAAPRRSVDGVAHPPSGLHCMYFGPSYVCGFSWLLLAALCVFDLPVFNLRSCGRMKCGSHVLAWRLVAQEIHSRTRYRSCLLPRSRPRSVSTRIGFHVF